MERSIPNLPLSKLCAVHFALQSQGQNQNSPDRGQSQKIRFSKSPGSGLKANLVNSVFAVFPGKIDKMFPKSWFSKRIFGDSAGSTKSDRPHCKHFWQNRALFEGETRGEKAANLQGHFLVSFYRHVPPPFGKFEGSAGKGAAPFSFPRKAPLQHPCQQSLHHRVFLQHSSRHPPSHFLGFLTVSESTPTPWSGPFQDHGLNPPSEHRKT